jgi:hypothetical protein
VLTDITQHFIRVIGVVPNDLTNQEILMVWTSFPASARLRTRDGA